MIDIGQKAPSIHPTGDKIQWTDIVFEWLADGWHIIPPCQPGWRLAVSKCLFLCIIEIEPVAYLLHPKRLSGGLDPYY
ncbi:MAG: hypothetical protein JXB49_05845, partial [Bacteroidales bacterium]|nr:hypothetical protein [Bacteroidales bacterium]